MDTEPGITNAAGRVEQMIKEEKDRGELVETPFAIFHFSYFCLLYTSDAADE